MRPCFSPIRNLLPHISHPHSPRLRACGGDEAVESGVGQFALGGGGICRVSHEWIYLHIARDKRDDGDLHEHQRIQKRSK